MKLFEVDNGTTKLCNVTPIERQRRLDGSPLTAHGASSLKPADTKIYLDSFAKSATVEKKKELDADEIVKSFLRS